MTVPHTKPGLHTMRGDGLIFCLGGAVTDRTYQALSPLRNDTSNPVSGRLGYGGVARNVAENLSRLGVKATLASVIGDDATGRSLHEHAATSGIDVRLLSMIDTAATAEYLAILEPDGQLKLGLADMAIFDHMNAAWIAKIWSQTTHADWIFADCNLPHASLTDLLGRCGASQRRLAVDGVSIDKCLKLSGDLSAISLLFLNADEAMALSQRADPLSAARTLHQRGARHVVVTCAADGLIIASHDSVQTLAASPAHVVNVTGAGDALIAATLAALIVGCHPADQLNNAAPLASLTVGLQAAALTVSSTTSVSPELSPERLHTWLAASLR
jgi:pseudouridine kinase